MKYQNFHKINISSNIKLLFFKFYIKNIILLNIFYSLNKTEAAVYE